MRDDQRQDRDAVDADTHELEAETRRRHSVAGMECCGCRYAQTVSRDIQGTISDEIETLAMQIRTICDQKHTGDNQ